jgi:hypothetical protein
MWQQSPLQGATRNSGDLKHIPGDFAAGGAGFGLVDCVDELNQTIDQEVSTIEAMFVGGWLKNQGTRSQVIR